MPATGILAIRRAGEDQYHTLELCLTLCGREDASDTHLQNLIGAVDGNRRGSFMPALTSSDERTKLFETRLGLRVITSFLDHNSGEPGHGGAAGAARRRCAVTPSPWWRRRARAQPTPLVCHRWRHRPPHRTQIGRR